MNGHRRQGVWGRVWEELKSKRSALVSLWMVVLMAVLALGADFIANDKPYYIEIDGESYFPILLE